jgi:hypothetical protein
LKVIKKQFNHQIINFKARCFPLCRICIWSILSHSTYMRVSNFGQNIDAKMTNWLIRESTYTQVYTVHFFVFATYLDFEPKCKLNILYISLSYHFCYRNFKFSFNMVTLCSYFYCLAKILAKVEVFWHLFQFLWNRLGGLLLATRYSTRLFKHLSL